MQSLNALMKNLERSPQWRANSGLRQVLALWPQLVGEAVAQHSRPTKVYRGVLQVSVSSAAWAQTLTFERPLILKKLHAKLPTTKTEITDMRFAPAQWQRESQQPYSTDVAPLHAHPSWAGLPLRRSPLLPKTADAAFQQWANRRRSQLASQSQCPRCQSPCPTQELQRWSVCAICVTHQWRTVR
jgi:predicted nucleic acid-binding Zn ribbon protein